jgi:uncharacterized membrane protein YphA (DoxX/SURF4 family)
MRFTPGWRRGGLRPQHPAHRHWAFVPAARPFEGIRLSAPSPVASLSGLLILAAFLKTVGAFLFLIGAYTRIVAFILSGEMAFAYFTAHAPRSFYPVVNAGELAVLFCFIFLYFAFAGGGPWSADRAMLSQA